MEIWEVSMRTMLQNWKMACLFQSRSHPPLNIDKVLTKQEMMEDWEKYWGRSSWERRKISKMKTKGSATIFKVLSQVSNCPFQSRNISEMSILRKLILTTRGKTDTNSSEESSTWTHAIHLLLLLTRRSSSSSTSLTSFKLEIKTPLNLKKDNLNLRLMSGKLEIGANAKLTSTKFK